MTKEELKQKAEEEARKHWLAYPLKQEIFKQAYLAGAEPREKRIAELEKENAELKDYRLTTLAKQQTDMSKYALNLEHKLSWYDDQLTKAKELLERFLGLGNLWDLDCKDYFPLRKEAEQFIKDSEGK